MTNLKKLKDTIIQDQKQTINRLQQELKQKQDFIEILLNAIKFKVYNDEEKL